MRRDNLKISVTVDDFISVLIKKRDKEIKDFNKYRKKYNNESLKYFKIAADEMRKVADNVETGRIPKGVDREGRYNNRERLSVPVKLMKIPCEPNTGSINSLIKALGISSSKNISLDKYEYENFFSDSLDD